MITRRDFDARVADKMERQRKYQEWAAANPKDLWEAENPEKDYHWANPFNSRGSDFRSSDWEPFDNSSVYYDDVVDKLSAEIKQYNRVAVIIQGLFDRSECLHPHKRVRSWTPQGFAEAIELVYDGMGLTYGEPPSFEVYRARCNAQIDINSVLIGQDHAWQRREAEAECRRIANDWRSRSDTYRPKLLRPAGDEGPGYLARPSKVMPRAGKAVFTWLRKRRSGGHLERFDYVRATVSVPFAELFNVSAYKRGDFKLFFSDPRTREQYLEWAPLLIAAEEYVSGGREAQGPVT